MSDNINVLLMQYQNASWWAQKCRGDAGEASQEYREAREIADRCFRALVQTLEERKQ